MVLAKVNIDGEIYNVTTKTDLLKLEKVKKELMQYTNRVLVYECDERYIIRKAHKMLEFIIFYTNIIYLKLIFCLLLFD